MMDMRICAAERRRFCCKICKLVLVPFLGLRIFTYLGSIAEIFRGRADYRKMKEILSAACIFLCGTGAVSAFGLRADLVVHADQAKADGGPWDGLPGAGGGAGAVFVPVPQPMSPPDLVVCLIERTGNRVCETGRGREQNIGPNMLPRCQDRRECTFRNVELPTETFGLLILDIDTRSNDLVDMVILSVSETLDQEAVEEVTRQLRAAANRLAAVILPTSRRARENEIQVLNLSQCAQRGRACRLLQSQIWFDLLN